MGSSPLSFAANPFYLQKMMPHRNMQIRNDHVPSTRRLTFFAVVVVACAAVQSAAPSLASGPTTRRAVKAVPADDWNARFAGNEGWIGGDGVYSTTLGDDRVLFLFGDTLLGKVNDGRRAGATMVNNTVGLMPLKPPDAPIRFEAGKTDVGKPAAVFTRTGGGNWFWPQAAIELNGRLYVFLTEVEKTYQSGAFGFKLIGQWLGVIENPLDNPAEWKVSQQRLRFATFDERRERPWGSAVLVEGDYVYVYGIEDHRQGIGNKQLMIARAPVDKLPDFDVWQFRAGDEWGKEVSTAGMPRGLANEFSVSRLPGDAGYILVYTENGLGERILGRVAASPEGPWSDPVLLYTCPEMTRDKGVFCYAAKAHPWAAEGDELLISYCVNSWKFERLFEDNEIYRPRFVRVRLAGPDSSDDPFADRPKN